MDENYFEAVVKVIDCEVLEWRVLRVVLLEIAFSFIFAEDCNEPRSVAETCVETLP